MLFPTSIGLSRRRRIPVIYVQAKTYLPHQYLWKAIQFRSWSILEHSDEHVVIRYKGYVLRLTPYYFGLILTEWHKQWRQYLPSPDLHGKTVLDVGAGEGETAFFYLLHGAGRVICVEADPGRVRLLKTNIAVNHWNAEAIERPFDLDMFATLKFDFVKMDIEGGEKVLASLDKLPAPMVIESHGETTQVLRDHFDLRTLFEGKGSALLANYIPSG